MEFFGVTQWAPPLPPSNIIAMLLNEQEKDTEHVKTTNYPNPINKNRRLTLVTWSAIITIAKKETRDLAPFLF